MAPLNNKQFFLLMLQNDVKLKVFINNYLCEKHIKIIPLKLDAFKSKC